jgi:hypothetical protein
LYTSISKSNKSLISRSDEVVALQLAQQIVALAKYEDGLLKPFRVFPKEG